MQKDTFVWIVKEGDTTGQTRKQVGSWAADPRMKGSLPNGYKLENPDDAIKYAPASNPSDEVKKRLGKNVVVTNEPVEEVLELANPIVNETLEPETEDLDELFTPDLTETDENKETETKEAHKAEVVETVAVATKTKRPYNRKK